MNLFQLNKLKYIIFIISLKFIIWQKKQKEQFLKKKKQTPPRTLHLIIFNISTFNSEVGQMKRGDYMIHVFLINLFIFSLINRFLLSKQSN